MSWVFEPAFDAGHRAALAAGKNFVYVCPPAWWTLLPLFDQCPRPESSGLHTLVLTTAALEPTEAARTLSSCENLGSVVAATGLTRVARLLADKCVGTLIATPADVVALLRRSAVTAADLRRIAIAWPELMIADGSANDLDTILAEVGTAQRVVATADEAVTSDFIERHARRTPMAVAARVPEQPTALVRYAVTEAASLRASVRAALDIIDPATALIWDPTPESLHRWREFEVGDRVRVGFVEADMPVDLAITVHLPPADVLKALTEQAREIVALVRAAQVPYLRSITERARTLRLPSDVDRARDRAAQLREEVRGLVERNKGSNELLALAPLFDIYDPATVAAALASERVTHGAAWSDDQQVPTWVRLHANVGRQDRISTGDIVGAILNTAGVSKRQVGKVELRDRFTLVEVRTEVAQRVLRSLDGALLKGKKVTARIDRR